MNKLKEKANVNEEMDAYMNLSFLSLGVIGDVKLLPGGAFDVKKWGFISQEELTEKFSKKQGISQNDDGLR